jgi:hypothetical protein
MGGHGKEARWHCTRSETRRRIKKKNMLIRGFPFIALGIVLLTIATRLPSLQHPQAIDDEAAYSVVANEIVDGDRPYIDAVDRKPPLLFWTYAAVFVVAGKYNWMALHAVALGVAW